MAKPTGTEIGKLLEPLSGAAREAAILKAFEAGYVPELLTNFRPVQLTATIDGVPRKLTIGVGPLPFSLGTNDDYLEIGTWPTTAQQILDKLGAILPSAKIAKAIADQSAIKISNDTGNPGAPYYLFPPAVPSAQPNGERITETGAFLAGDLKRRAAIAKAASALGVSPWNVLVGGHMKALISGNPAENTKGSIINQGLKRPANPTGHAVRIYGGRGGPIDGWAVQPRSTVHDWFYGPDYSHAIYIVSRLGTLDDTTPVDLVALHQDPKLHALVSDEGAYDPRYPRFGPGGGFQPASVGEASGLLPGSSGGSGAEGGSQAGASLGSVPRSGGGGLLLAALTVLGGVLVLGGRR